MGLIVTSRCGGGTGAERSALLGGRDGPECQRAPRFCPGAATADGGGAGGSNGMAAPKQAGLVTHSHRRQVRGGGSSYGGFRGRC